ncbi:hypothetical protein LLEC1_04611 [Akanthomyces lecanii]|uniref:NADP-dependent oxidoreductase domain-containing protein n=1 Tax=Cordyceps confragosa TaxID=2714763 RepID=A0A179IFK9_CORDF|nr:hypothetical protein LLEC1_04611 [Akanthomyces lecanii]
MAPVAITPEASPERPMVVKKIDGPNRSKSSSVSSTHSVQSVKLNDGNTIPTVALGVYKAPNGQETEDATGTPRDEVFICSKLWDADHGYEATFNALCSSLDKFGLDYLDLYLIHSPADDEEKRLESWRALETAQRLGKVKSIGVSNFGAAHIENLIENATVVPAVNQVEVHPFCQRQALVDLCDKHGIKIEAYSPLARGNKLEDPTIGKIADKYGKTPAQILLNWNAARGNVVLPKSLTAHRIKSNFESFDFKLSAEDVATIDALESNYVTGSMHKSED